MSASARDGPGDENLTAECGRSLQVLSIGSIFALELAQDFEIKVHTQRDLPLRSNYAKRFRSISGYRRGQSSVI